MKPLELIVPEALAHLTSKAATPQSPSPLVDSHPWRFECFHPALRPILPAVKAFCLAALSDDNPRWLTLLGPSGVGKTLILTQAYLFLRRYWRLERKTQWPDGSWSGRTRTHAHIKPGRDLDTYQAPADYARFDLIYVEDIGSGQGLEKGAGAVTKSRLAELLQLRTNKWTLCDANLSRGEIEEKLDSRIASRLNRDSSHLIEIPADVPDYSDWRK